MAKTVVSGSPEDANNLLNSPGWKTLVTILKESGGSPQQYSYHPQALPRPKKRPTQNDAPGEEDAGDGGYGESSSSHSGRHHDGLGADSGCDNNNNNEEKRLAKKMRGVSIKDNFSLR